VAGSAAAFCVGGFPGRARDPSENDTADVPAREQKAPRAAAGRGDDAITDAFGA
jgi:hypothetical protein